MFQQIESHSEIVDRIKDTINNTGIMGMIIVFLLGVALVGSLCGLITVGSGIGMTDATDAQRVLTESGYRNVQIIGYRWFTCDRSDYYHTGFKAVSPSGTIVTGTVCRGFLFKSNTIRLD